MSHTGGCLRHPLAAFPGERHMFRAFLAGLAALAAAMLTTSGAATAQSRRNATYLPDVPVVLEDGTTVRFHDLIKDKLVVISFFYTNCPDLCPLTTARLARVKDKLGDAVGRDIFFLSLSVDPAHDTPALVKAYAEAFDAGPGWHFVTGRPEDINAITSKLGDRSQ